MEGAAAERRFAAKIMSVDMGSDFESPSVGFNLRTEDGRKLAGLTLGTEVEIVIRGGVKVPTTREELGS